MPEARSREAGPWPAAAAAPIDAGLRRYMLAIYAKVAAGLALAAALAYLTATIPAVRDALFRAAPGAPNTPQFTTIGLGVAMAPLFVLVAFAGALNRPSPLATGVLYWSVASLFGASMGLLVLSFTGHSIAGALVVSAAAFGGLSLVGYTAKADLTAFGSFLTVGLLGLLGGLALNLFLGSPALQFALSAAGVLVFAGLIAWQTQGLKLAYAQVKDDPRACRAATNVGALCLFVGVLNLVQFLLMTFAGERR